MVDIYRVKLLALDEGEDEATFNHDFFLDTGAIKGFWINESQENREINILIYGEAFTILSEPHIEKHLVDKFVKGATAFNGDKTYKIKI